MAGSRLRCMVAVVLFLQGSCAPTKRPAPDPASTVVYDFTTEGRFPEAPEVARTPTSLAKPQAMQHRVEDSDAVAVQGWRVQVFAGHSLEIAQSIQRELQLQSSEVVYIDYVEPYYKVRIGDCAARATCDELLRELHAQGRESAWVVQSVIHR